MGSLFPGSTRQEYGGKEVVLTRLVQWRTHRPHSHLPGVVENRETNTVWRGEGRGLTACIFSLMQQHPIVSSCGPQVGLLHQLPTGMHNMHMVGECVGVRMGDVWGAGPQVCEGVGVCVCVRVVCGDACV